MRQRLAWKIKPATKIKESKKIYDRKSQSPTMTTFIRSIREWKEEHQ